MALVRLYRDGRPATFANPLSLSPAGPKEGDLVFVPGFPGSTERLLTNAQLEFQRDHFLPWRIEYLAQIRGSLLAEATKGEEESRQVNDALQGVENSLKVFKGQRGALVEPSFFCGEGGGREEAAGCARRQRRAALQVRRSLRRRRSRSSRPETGLPAVPDAGSALRRRLGPAQRRAHAGSRRGRARQARGSAPAGILATRASSRPKGAVLAEAPVHPVLEKLEIAFWLDKTREYLGADHPAVKALFGSQSSLEIASRHRRHPARSATATSARRCGRTPTRSPAPTIPPSRWSSVSMPPRGPRARNTKPAVSGPLSVASRENRQPALRYVSARTSIPTPTSPCGCPMAW